VRDRAALQQWMRKGCPLSDAVSSAYATPRVCWGMDLWVSKRNGEITMTCVCGAVLRLWDKDAGDWISRITDAAQEHYLGDGGDRAYFDKTLRETGLDYYEDELGEGVRHLFDGDPSHLPPGWIGAEAYAQGRHIPIALKSAGNGFFLRVIRRAFSKGAHDQLLGKAWGWDHILSMQATDPHGEIVDEDPC